MHKLKFQTKQNLGSLVAPHTYLINGHKILDYPESGVILCIVYETQDKCILRGRLWQKPAPPPTQPPKIPQGGVEEAGKGENIPRIVMYESVSRVYCNNI